MSEITYYLHFIGKRLYPKERFIKEAEKYKVNRALPWFTIKNLKWGDIILLAYYENNTAKVFGYFKVESLSFSGATEEFTDNLYKNIDIISVKNVNKKLFRWCGSYVLSNVIYVKDALKNIVEKSVKISKDLKTHIKFFVGGTFVKFDKIIDIFNVKFNRNVIKISQPIPTEIITKIPKEKKLCFMEFYRQKKYITNRDLNRKLVEFL